MKSFASDNYSSVSDEIMRAIINANVAHVGSYGADKYTAEAEELFRKTFGDIIKAFFVYNGTAANVLGLQAVLRSHHAIICADTAHIVTHEVNAIVNSTGCSTLLIPSSNGKITAEQIENCFEEASYWGFHANMPKVVSITQPTEFGTLYTVKELEAISNICKKNKLFFHMDGCRLSNAAVALNCDLSEITRKVGVDILSFGGSKNGLMFGEVVIFFNPALADEVSYIQKQSLQLNSKMRYLSAQFIPYLADNIWYRNAAHANKMARLLCNGLKNLHDVIIEYPVETNQIFLKMPEKMIKTTVEKYPFYIRNHKKNQIRLVTSFDTVEHDVSDFLALCGYC